VTPSILDPKSLVDYAKSLDCIHCGLCLPTCPTYQLTGAESSSPRGRIHLMRSVAEGELDAGDEFREEMEFCLVCRHCESVCPAGVQFGQMMEYARDALPQKTPRGALERLARHVGFRVLLPSRALLRVAGSLLRFVQVTGLVQLAGRVAGARGDALRYLPTVPPAASRSLLPARVAAQGATRRSVLVLEGCVMPELFGRVNHATVRSLARLGVECRTAASSVCCGALHAHNGDLEGARDLGRRMIEASERVTDADGAPLAIVVNSAGCGAHMKELGHLFAGDETWSARARAFAARVVDYAELALPLLRESDVRPSLDLGGTVTWDAPCHLCHGQRVRAEPLALLDAIEGLERVPLEDEESCCGSAGIYSVLRPNDSNAVLAPKLDALERSGANVLVTANPGCHMQWEAGVRRRGLAVRVMHLAEVVDAALD
jgi:glycolate oxidase iron-sulfur subunit